MSKCSQCNTAISFMSVLNTVNPFKVKCSNCKEPVHIDKKSGGIAVFIIFAIITPILIIFYGSAGYWLKVMFPVIAVAEIGYFLLIKKGIVKLHNKPINQDK